MSSDTNRDREAREILRGIADEEQRAWLAKHERPGWTSRERILLAGCDEDGWQRLPPPKPAQTVVLCRALLESVRRARAGGAA